MNLGVQQGEGTMLTERNRLKYALLKEPVDRPPCICPGGMMNMVTRDVMLSADIKWPEAHQVPDLMAQLAEASYKLDCFENYGLPFCMTIEAEELGAGVNMGSFTYEPHVEKYVTESVSDWDHLPALNHDQGRVKTVIQAIALLKEKEHQVPIIGNLSGPISVATSLMEPTVFYKELRKKNGAAHDFLHFISEQILNFGKAQVQAGADVIAISDPSGTGEILGPKLFAEFALPYINQIIKGLKTQRDDLNVIVHICGKMQSVYEPLALIQAEALSFDAVVNLREAKEKLPGHAIMGNVSTYALEFSGPKKVAALTSLCLQNGADIIAPACGMGNRTPLANMQAILQSVKGERHEQN